MQTRRGLITGLISLVAAPAIIRVNHLMPISIVPEPIMSTVKWQWKKIAIPVTRGYYDPAYGWIKEQYVSYKTQEELDRIMETLTVISSTPLTKE